MGISKATASSVAPGAKGDLVVGSATNDAAILTVGTNNHVLTADSATATGLKWAAVAGGGLTLLSTTALSGSSTSVTGISGSYTNLLIVISRLSTTLQGTITATFNSDTGTNYQFNGASNASLFLSRNIDVDAVATASNNWVVNLYRYVSTTEHKPLFVSGGYVNANTAGQETYAIGGAWRNNAALTSLQVITSAGTFDGGNIYIYGVN